MYFSPLASVATLLFFLLAALASPIAPRDNACTACRVIFTKVQSSHPADIFAPNDTCPPPTTESKTTAFQTEICDTFSAADDPFYGFVNEYCTSFLAATGQALFDFLLTNDDPLTVCHQFGSC